MKNMSFNDVLLKCYYQYQGYELLYHGVHPTKANYVAVWCPGVFITEHGPLARVAQYTWLEKHPRFILTRRQRNKRFHSSDRVHRKAD